MKQNSFLWVWLVLVCVLADVPAGKRAEGAGSADTRLIAIGFNFLTAAPFTPGHLFEIDKQTGGLTPIGSGFTREFDHIGPNLAGNSSDQLFNALGAAFDARVNQLTLSGDVAHSVPLSDGTAFAPYVHAIAFNSQDHLHGILLNGAPNVDAPPVLAEINTSTGLASTLTVLDSLEYTSMAFDLQDSLYAVAENIGLMRIDATTGDATIIGGDLMNRSSLDISRRPVVFDRDRTMFAAADRLLVVDPSTGSTTAVGSGGFPFPYSMVGLAIVAVPEPGTLTMIGFAALVLCGLPGRLLTSKMLVGRQRFDYH